MNHDPFKEYIRESEPDKRDKGYAWHTAIGLQAVDGLKTSEYLVHKLSAILRARYSLKRQMPFCRPITGKILPAMPETVPKRLTRFQPESPCSFPRMRSASRQMSSFPYTESCLPVSILMQDVFGITILRKRNGCLMGRR